MTKINTVPTDAANGPTTVAEITDKRGYGERWKFSPRHVDNLIAQGLPHLKIGKRRVGILIAEADAWMRERFGQQRRAPFRTSATGKSNGEQEAA